MAIPNLSIWTDFFEAFKELPVLWQVKSELFRDRNKKRQAWEKLLVLYQKIEPTANVDSLKKRLVNIKTCYRRELKKVEKSIRSGPAPGDEYVPILWYYDLLDFLRDQDCSIPEVSAMDMEQEEPPMEEEGCEQMPSSPSSNSCSVKRRKNMTDLLADKNALLKEALRHYTKENKDEASIYAEGWATSFRKLSALQQIYAKKAIDEILSLGQLDALTFDCVKSHHIISWAGTSQESTQVILRSAQSELKREYNDEQHYLSDQTYS